MKKIIYIAMVTLLSTVAYAQKQNLDKLSEKERNEYLLKTALPIVIKHAPEWYSAYKEPVIVSYLITWGPQKGRLIYAVRYLPDLQKMDMEGYEFSVAVTFWSDTGEVNGIGTGDGWGHSLPKEPQTRSNEKPLYIPNPYLKK